LGWLPNEIAVAKKIAAAKSGGYQTELRMGIAEGIGREGSGVDTAEGFRQLDSKRVYFDGLARM